jgi:uncharacterized damage-inducible protein DinB
MTISEVLAAEFSHEAATTRRHLERIPDDKLEWRPHEKSFTLGALGAHIAECVGWARSICGGEEYNFDPATYQPIAATSNAALLAAFDERVAAGAQAMARITDADLMTPWRLAIRGKVRFEKPKVVVLRDFTLSHLVHHRGQLTVYLRLLNVPVPGSYGPTADERG